MKEEFKKLKKRILKQYPEAKTMIDNSGKYYIIDKNKKKIIPENALFFNTITVYDAWKSIDIMLHTQKLLDNSYTDEILPEK